MIVGYARSDLKLDDFKTRISSRIKVTTDAEKQVLAKFLELCTYVSGKYDEDASFIRLNDFISRVEPSSSTVGAKAGLVTNRVFYMVKMNE